MEDFALFPLAPKKGIPSKDDGSCDFISRGDGKGRGACLSQLIVRVIRNSGGDSESNRSATVAKEASEGEEERKGSGEEGRGRTACHTLPPPGGNHMLPGFMSTPASERGRSTGKASPPPVLSHLLQTTRASFSPRFSSISFSSLRSTLAGAPMLDPFVLPDYGMPRDV